MTRSRSAPRTSTSHTLIVGTFLFLLAVVLAVAPLPLLVRSLGIVLSSYAAFAFAGLPFAFAAALFAPVAGLLTGGETWLVLLPLMLVSGLLALLGLDYAWRVPALVVSPLLYVLPQGGRLGAFTAFTLRRGATVEPVAAAVVGAARAGGNCRYGRRVLVGAGRHCEQPGA